MRVRGARGWALSPDEPHDPGCGNHHAHKRDPAVSAIANHGFRRGALRDSENHRCEGRKEQHRDEMGGSVHQAFLPMRRLWASTAEMKFSSPATTINLVPWSAVASWIGVLPNSKMRPMA